MFRVANAFLAAAAMFAASALFQAGAATGAQAGQTGVYRVTGAASPSQARFSGKRSYRKKVHSRGVRHHRRFEGVHFGRRHGSVRFDNPAASSGVVLQGRVSGRRTRADHRRPGWHGGSGPKIIRVGKPAWRGHRHDGRHAGDSIAIVVGQGGGDAAPPRGQTVILEGSRCEADTYCTLRLGPYANSPKIITLNTSGATITESGLE